MGSTRTKSGRAPGGSSRSRWCKAVVSQRGVRVFGAFGVVALVVCASAATLAGQLSPRPTRPHVIPPKGPARQVIFKYCTSCHGIDDYAYYAQDRAKWDALLTTKHRGLDVPLPAADRAILLDWLAERFSPDRWRVVIVDMRERGAKIEDEEVERLVEWLGRTKGTNQ